MTKRREETTHCCLCGKPLVGRGHNPDPMKHAGRACDDCNVTRVIPARLMALKQQLLAEARER